MRVMLATLVLGLLTAGQAIAQPTVFVVRHAERADAGSEAAKMMGADPDLSGAGVMRAAALARLLEDAKITAIFTTEYKRARQTAAPLATALGIQATVVPSKDVAGLAKKVRSATGAVLIVGHSNTVPEILAALGIGERVTIGEDDFTNLFIVVGQTLVRLHY